ncbi:hypothetical protein IscW_ISCW002173 [Ixodes scapularis]|uniref:Uncharacterized protein n=1 Tax=Ixodes scapularis TaxID=6945 RepID=B7P9C2_IXOSC|nr:hypothetical protein IscW_ISCW002173 [Ixodes scapularis]|eukprot:XP_002403925.1 hypothetical protein IscW_ISCW002173 [Ixodes scapularis]
MEERRECATDRNAPDRVRKLPQSHPREGKALCHRRVSDVPQDLRCTRPREILRRHLWDVVAQRLRNVPRKRFCDIGAKRPQDRTSFRGESYPGSRPHCACGRNLGALRIGPGRVRLRVRWIWGRVQRQTTCDSQSVA